MLLPFTTFFSLVYAITGFCGTLESRLWNTNMIRYSYSELFSLDHHLPPSTCIIKTLRSFKLLHRPRYLHRGSRRCFYPSPAGINVLHSSSRRSRHLNSRGICSSNLHFPQKTLQNRVKNASSKIRLAQLNVRSMNKKAALLHDIILDRKLDFLCLCETWHQPNDFITLI